MLEQLTNKPLGESMIEILDRIIRAILGYGD